MKTQCMRRMFVAAALSLSLASVTAKEIASESRQLVQPSHIAAGQPFSFALTNTVSGAVIQVQKVSGEVVQSARADRYGRVFVPAGLAAGAYVISSAGRISLPPGGGRELQRSLLEAEGVEVDGSRVDLRRYLWKPRLRDLPEDARA